MAALTASCYVVTALLASLLPQTYMCIVSGSSAHKDDLSRLLQASMLLYQLHAYHVQVDITMLSLQSCCKLSHACSMSAQSPKDSSQIDNPASGTSNTI